MYLLEENNMKKIMLVLVMLAMLVGCAGLNTNVPVNVATDVAFVMVLKNNPSYKPQIVAALNTVKIALGESLTYDDLMVMISKQFPEKYAYVGVILSSYVATDKPIFETYLPMLDEYKAGIILKIDRLLLLTEV